jgi:hypothetical protein
MRSFASVLVLSALSIASIGCESNTSTTSQAGASDPDSKAAPAVARKPGTQFDPTKTKQPPKLRGL